MSTEVLAPLAIPEQVVVGSGSYTIPADRYGYLAGSCSFTGLAYGPEGLNSTFNTTANFYYPDYQGGSSANSNQQWVKEGDTISVSSNFPNRSVSIGAFSGSYVGGVNSLSGYYRILLNGQVFCVAFASARATSALANGFATLYVTFDGQVGWSVSLYRIPKANLPTGLAEGE